MILLHLVHSLETFTQRHTQLDSHNHHSGNIDCIGNVRCLIVWQSCRCCNDLLRLLDLSRGIPLWQPEGPIKSNHPNLCGLKISHSLDTLPKLAVSLAFLVFLATTFRRCSSFNASCLLRYESNSCIADSGMAHVPLTGYGEEGFAAL